ncbi:MAG: hypothetical protein K0Q77_573 [Anaerosporomusa subterranea]|jgi:hypothetical protein|nr:hypothetical protein [Anaerosporomusa subterranea]
MQEESVLEFFQALGFEEIDIEDGLTALSVEFAPTGNYALITNEEGTLPEKLRQNLIFACYTPEGAYQWSVGFKNSYVFTEIWSTGESLDQRCEAVRQYGESKETE